MVATKSCNSVYCNITVSHSVSAGSFAERGDAFPNVHHNKGLYLVGANFDWMQPIANSEGERVLGLIVRGLMLRRYLYIGNDLIGR